MTCNLLMGMLNPTHSCSTKRVCVGVGGGHLPLPGRESVGGEPLMSVTRGQPVRCQTYRHLPSSKASPPIGWYQIILLDDRGTCVLTTCPTRQWGGRDSNSRPNDHKCSTLPLSHRTTQSIKNKHKSTKHRIISARRDKAKDSGADTSTTECVAAECSQ